MSGLAANDSALWAPSRTAWRRHDCSLSSALCPLFSSPARTFYQCLFGDCGLSAALAHLRTSTWLMWLAGCRPVAANTESAQTD